MDIPAVGLRIDYVKGRRSLRLTASNGNAPVEVPLRQLMEQLDIDRRDLLPQPRLLLFAGMHGESCGGAGDLAGWFDNEDEARAAFREVRAKWSDGEGWAELVALDGGPRPAVRAWFGRAQAERRLRLVAGRHRHPSGRGGHVRLLVR